MPRYKVENKVIYEIGMWGYLLDVRSLECNGVFGIGNVAKTLRDPRNFEQMSN